MSNGKGSSRRPRQVTRKQYDENWDAVFGKKETVLVPKRKPAQVFDDEHPLTEESLRSVYYEEEKQLK